MRLFIVGAMLIAAGVEFSTPASADPTPPPAPPYVIAGPSEPMVGGLRTLPPVCAVQPRACNLNWSPDTGSWVAQPGI
jgi:hypothetical protein